MCQFTLQKYADCGHTKLLTDAINTVFCKPIAKQLQRSCYQGLDVAPACCHPLPIPQDNEIAAALQEDLDFDTYNQEDENRIAKLRDSIEESGKKAEKIVEDFEVSMNNDITRLNLNETLLEPGRKKYDELFMQVLLDCRDSINTLVCYMQQRVPRRMFEDLVHFIEKKAARAAERAGQLSSIGEYIVGDAGSGENKEAIASLFGDIAESVFVERYGFAPQRAAEHGYLNERHEDSAHIISCSETEAKRLVEIELVTSEYVPAKRNNAGSALYDFPMRQRDFGARLAMSNATFANDKLPNIMRQRDLKVIVTNVLLPHIATEEAVREAMRREKLEKQNLEKEKLLTAFMEQYSLYEEVPLDEETATSPDEGRTSADADGSKLPASEPAHSIWIKHEKFVDVDRPSLTSKEAIALALRCEYPLGDDDDWECNEVPQESAQVPSEEATQPAPKPKPDTVGRTFTCDFGDNDDDREDRETLVESSEEVDASAPPFNSDTKMEADKHMPSTPTCSTYGTISPHVSTQSPSPSPQSSLGPILRKRSSEQDPPHDKSPSQKSRKNSDASSGEEMWLKDSESTADDKVDGDTTVESTPATEDVGMPQTPAQNAASPSSYQSTPSPPWHITIGPRATIEFGAATPLGPIVRKRRSEDDILGDESPLQKARMNCEREG
ncbi:hypothetical protein HBH53_211300 [Parastagonospora nodorum]|nr:hypothetical protein HBH53_211300 [Parastagonospora nodorum]KAH3978312.1 hypothetical protein HBH52_108140 [Parastagonospora nodorum]KAH4052869.1 hypothetical protein HBH49_091800 [Parastagonospora nodorum]KAH4122118.1 hypothetical protein HBH47_087590 [Parastagonospora nodorum]KAH4179202.1 hypothetical protein HBH43_014170 [Parastagonospora nodorum]